MKILHLITKSNYGGAQKYVYDLAVAGQARGHTVMVACGGTGEAGAAGGKLVELLHEKNIPVLMITQFMRDLSLLRDGKAFFQIISILRAERPDVLHISSSKAGGIGALAGRITKVPNIVFTVHGLPTEEKWRPCWQQLLIKLATNLTVRLAHQVITITSVDYETLADSDPQKQKVTLIPNGIAPFNPLPTSEAKKVLFPDLPPNALVIGGIGELHPNKNWQLLLHVVKTLPKNIHACIIGTGTDRESLGALVTQLDIKERVHFATCTSGASQYLSVFDVYVLPSKKEGLPFVLLEAGMAGLPVVASDLPGTRDIIDTGENGLVVEPQTTAFSAAIQILLRDPGMRKRLGQQLHTTVTTRFSITTMIEATYHLYESTMPETADCRTA